MNIHANEYNHLALTELPDYFNKDKLPSLGIHQIVFWDEVHKKVKIGSCGDTTISFPRDSNGKLSTNVRRGNFGRRMVFLNVQVLAPR